MHLHGGLDIINQQAKDELFTSYGAEEEDEEAKFDIDDDFNDDDNKEDEDDLCEI